MDPSVVVEGWSLTLPAMAYLGLVKVRAVQQASLARPCPAGMAYKAGPTILRHRPSSLANNTMFKQGLRCVPG
jgi:hypothetical protein